MNEDVEHMTPRECADELSQQTQDLDRRERYAAAMHSKRTGDLGTPWERLSPDIRSLWLLRADAAMAVADEEISRYRRELRRVNRKLEDARSGCDRLRAELEYRTASYEELVASLRAELSARYRELNGANATIERVRSVLDEWYGTSDASALSAEIRAALEGEQ